MWTVNNFNIVISSGFFSVMHTATDLVQFVQVQFPHVLFFQGSWPPCRINFQHCLPKDIQTKWLFLVSRNNASSVHRHIDLVTFAKLFSALATAPFSFSCALSGI